MNMFEQAARLKLRFAVGARVNLTVENLWDLPLTNVKGEDLDHIAIELQEKLKLINLEIETMHTKEQLFNKWVEEGEIINVEVYDR